ncbi:hypothetical protein BDA96_01G282600 [Sorghum bicolor]|uniref:Uncharacterized protein n=2 Tax=Sorghum bicolor TaxID=4558 RepID=A0A921UZ43_SORBI|nr:hypothetical protein BDA96_08G131200 [Sorghum bicolor]KAG0521093.1 hypothetical protein BDA96_08G131300 [Sorghum bicolor]KAG0537867.1 hypothetical protein BDA96_03G185700 [Sorghum bicolor]KAG0549762.1 hypothetical protein BDA96_01G282600 [Sorghum bicolor]KAG0549763.1 hypothetical protein BDA96_01G282600 [Sorghum bicolor]
MFSIPQPSCRDLFFLLVKSLANERCLPNPDGDEVFFTTTCVAIAQSMSDLHFAVICRWSM